MCPCCLNEAFQKHIDKECMKLFSIFESEEWTRGSIDMRRLSVWPVFNLSNKVEHVSSSFTIIASLSDEATARFSWWCFDKDGSPLSAQNILIHHSISITIVWRKKKMENYFHLFFHMFYIYNFILSSSGTHITTITI